MDPNGQLPAYEFAFDDVNPPVHAWAAWRTYKMTGARGQRDRAFLERVFQKLLLNFTWWVNRKDAEGNNLFAGGFFGLDNIGGFYRSKPLPTRGGIGAGRRAGGGGGFFSPNTLPFLLIWFRETPFFEPPFQNFFYNA